MKKEINLDYLYLDLSVCTRCQGSDTNLEDSVSELQKKYPDTKFNLRKIHVNSLDLAHLLKFESSPTIRVNDQDLPIEFKENNCDSCGDFCGDSVDCRIWVYGGKEYESAPKEMLVGLISKYLEGEIKLKETDDNYKVSENLIGFFESRTKKETEASASNNEECCSSDEKSGSDCCPPKKDSEDKCGDGEGKSKSSCCG